MPGDRGPRTFQKAINSSEPISNPEFLRFGFFRIPQIWKVPL